ncbi:MAG: MFS transporter [Candidatus Omnitrophica bacterium]|nr:MFS transporter [Candidatus Omnitrophota bacterium]
MARFRDVLSNKNFLLLWLGQIVSQFGDRLNQMALVALVSLIAPGSSMAMAKVLACTLLPSVLVGPFAGAYVDRWDKRWTMVVCDLLRAGLVLFLVLALYWRLSLVPVYILVFLTFSVTRFFLPSKLAIVPELVAPKKLLVANSLASVTNLIAGMGSFALGGILVAQVGYRTALSVDAVTYLVSSVFLVMMVLPRVPRQAEPSVERKDGTRAGGLGRLLQEIREGIDLLWQHSESRFLLGKLGVLWAGCGVVSVVMVVFLQQSLNTVTEGLGVLVSFLVAGLFVGALGYGRLGGRYRRNRVMCSSLTAAGVLLLAAVLGVGSTGNAVLASVLTFTLGVVVAPMAVSSMTLVHEVVPENMHGRVFSSVMVVGDLAFLVCMLLASALSEVIGQEPILLGVGVVFVLLGPMGWGLQPRMAVSPSVTPR